MARRSILFTVPLLLFLLTASRAIAQPTLPDMTGSVEYGIVHLSWTCQYDGVKALSVLRSADSTAGFVIIGNVKKLAKGPQAFEDTNPPPGRTFYKLSLLFSSGLTWRTNYFGITVPQRVSVPPKVVSPMNDPRYARESDFRKNTRPAPDTCKKPYSQPTISLSMSADSSSSLRAEPIRPKIRLSIEDDGPSPPVFVQSRFIAINTITGHVDMLLPDDVNTHHYSIRFYDENDHMVVEVSKINNANVIFDRRNFQRKGTYKFVIRRDFIEFESGYININPN